MSWMRHDSTKSNQQFNVLHDLFPSAAQALQILEVSILEELFGVTVLEQSQRKHWKRNSFGNSVSKATRGYHSPVTIYEICTYTPHMSIIINNSTHASHAWHACVCARVRED